MRILHRIGWMTLVLAALAGFGTGCRTTKPGLTPDQKKALAESDFQRAMRLARAGKPDRAATALRMGLEMDPDHVQSRLFLAGLLQEAGQIPAALDQYDLTLKSLERTRTNKADRIVVYGNRGECLLGAGRFADAETNFTEALALAPGESTLLFKRGEARMGRKDYTNALADLTAVLDLRPNESAGWMRRGDCQFAMGRMNGAVDDYTLALERAPRDAYLFARRAIAYSALDQEEMALADYSRALDLEPENARRWYDRGLSRMAVDLPKEAVFDFNEALKRDPKRAEVLVARGMAQELAGDDVRALADYNMAMAVAPDYKPAEENRRRLLERLSATTHPRRK